MASVLVEFLLNSNRKRIWAVRDANHKCNICRLVHTIFLSLLGERMEHSDANLPLRTGLFFVAFAYFTFAFYEFTLSIFHRGTIWPMIVTDVPSVIGLGLRTAAGFIAVVTVLFYVTGRDLSGPETGMSLRWIVLLEAGYFLSLLPSGLLGLAFGVTSFSNFVESTLPCLVESIGIPILLAKLFFELSPRKPVKSPMKWVLISGTFYLLVYWLNNSGNWISAAIDKGAAYVLKPANLFSFIITTVGLLILTIYSAYFSKKSFGIEALSEFDLKTRCNRHSTWLLLRHYLCDVSLFGRRGRMGNVVCLVFEPQHGSLASIASNGRTTAAPKRKGLRPSKFWMQHPTEF